jgi:hypothetical protein
MRDDGEREWAFHGSNFSRTVKMRETDKNGSFQGHRMVSHGRGAWRKREPGDNAAKLTFYGYFYGF